MKTPYSNEHETFLRGMVEGASLELQTVEARLAGLREQLEVLQDKRDSWSKVLVLYLEEHGLLLEEEPTSVLDIYEKLGPSEMVERWADEHDGIVVIKELVNIAVASGAYRKRQSARNSLDSTIRKKKGFRWLAPGIFERAGQGMLTLGTPYTLDEGR